MITGALLAAAGSVARQRRCCSRPSIIRFWSTDLNVPMPSLPVVIFQFALSPYEDWQSLAWTGALIIAPCSYCRYRRGRFPRDLKS